MIDFKNLPVYKSKNLILNSLKNNSVIIVESPTGSGKTTQIPLILHEAGYDTTGIIGITQPRRIATLNVCSFINNQIQNQGLAENFCAYKMRFYDTTDTNTRIKILTDGMLLQELKADGMLSRYSVIMVDEAHERSLNIDFILGLLKDILSKRSDLKVIISSATINTKTFSKFFDNAPIISIDARIYDVSIKYCPIQNTNNSNSTETEKHFFGKKNLADYDALPSSICNIINSLLSDFKKTGYQTGTDTLIFLPGEADIKNTMSLIYEKCNYERLQIYPLYSRLNKEEQERVFENTEKGKMKVVLATNIAETSLTINGIKVVIDSGLAKINYYNQYNFTSSLISTPISRSSAMQRAGRAGRTSPGVCYRLYSANDYKERDMYTPEEILRTDLSEVVLRMVDLGIKNFEDFNFITKPAKKALESGEETLKLLGALNNNRELTETGSIMVKFPLLPRHAKCMAYAIQNDIEYIQSVATCVSFLSCKSPYVLPAGFEEEARAAHRRFTSEYGDFIGCQFLLKAYKKLETQKDKEFFCEKNYLDLQSMEEIVHVSQQLCDICREMDIPVVEREPSNTEEYAHRLLVNIISGLVQYVCVKKKSSVYSTPYTGEIFIHPGSSYFRDSPVYIVAGEIVLTSRMYARTVSPLKLSWIEETSPELAKELKRISSSLKERNANKTENKKNSDFPSEKKMSKNSQDRQKTYSIYGRTYPVIYDDSKKSKGVALIEAKDVRELYKTYIKSRRHPKSINAAIIYKGYYLNYGDRLYEVLSTGKNFDYSKNLISEVPIGSFFASSPEDLNKIKNNLDCLMNFAPLKKYKDRLGYISLVLSDKGYRFSVNKNFTEAINNSAYALLSLSDSVQDRAFSNAYNRIVKLLD